MPRKNTHTPVEREEEELGEGVTVDERTGEKVQKPDPVVPRENAVDPNSPAYL